jgi:hypothetical protein
VSRFERCHTYASPILLRASAGSANPLNNTLTSVAYHDVHTIERRRLTRDRATAGATCVVVTVIPTRDASVRSRFAIEPQSRAARLDAASPSGTTTDAGQPLDCRRGARTQRTGFWQRRAACAAQLADDRREILQRALRCERGRCVAERLESFVGTDVLGRNAVVCTDSGGVVDRALS